ncbi:MAG: aminotransferase class V-fold PLP-dependent enzyme [Bacteroidales bacterium]|nr:aminotransferase class V-fold PLP-dependent enzyme [Bacteroidales bacterium]
MMNRQDLCARFPQLSDTVYGKRLVYLDNAATSLRPTDVVQTWTQMSLHHNANLHRAVHRTAQEATAFYEQTRDAVRDFLHAGAREEIIFTSGTTAAINLLAFSIGETFIRPGDEIIVSEAEHHSNLVPWQMLCERKGAVLKRLGVDDGGRLRLEDLPALLGERTRLLCIAHISNVLGLVNPIREITDICHARQCMVLVDGAQGILHEPVDVQALDCDFYVFSGHKMFAAPGTGVLYGKRSLLERLCPWQGGGEMIASVSWEKTSYAPLPQKFEAGTQNIAGTPTLRPAIEVLESLRPTEEQAITEYLLDWFAARNDIRLFGLPDGKTAKIPLFSIAVEGAHHEDLALILDKMGVAVRSGQMCAEPLMDRFGVSGMLRASFAPYNTIEEAEIFVQSLEKAIKMLR